VTAKAIFERLYLVPGLRQFAPFVTMPSAPTPPPLTIQLFSCFPFIFLALHFSFETERKKDMKPVLFSFFLSSVTK